MAVQNRGTHTEYGIKGGDTVVPANDQEHARFLLRRLANCSPVLVNRRVKTVEHFWEEVLS
jgi:hypothetical protein